jgi:hypothetical protein
MVAEKPPGAGSARPSAQKTTRLGTQATTALISGNVAPSNSASSPPRDSPHTASRPPPSRDCARIQRIAFSQYSSGMLTRPRGRPSAAKYPRASAAYPQCEDGGPRLEDPPAAAHHDHRRMRALARREEEPPDDAVHANRHSAPATDKERHSELQFEPLHPGRHVRRDAVQPLPGAGDAARLGHGPEQNQVEELQRAFSFRDDCVHKYSFYERSASRDRQLALGQTHGIVNSLSHLTGTSGEKDAWASRRS